MTRSAWTTAGIALGLSLIAFVLISYSSKKMVEALDETTRVRKAYEAALHQLQSHQMRAIYAPHTRSGFVTEPNH